GSLLCAVALCVAGACSGSGGASRASDPSVVTVAGGRLKGTVSGDVRTFLGIPYAAPPVGARRWKAPQAPAPWNGTRDATRPGSRCPQTGLQGGSTNEDCLSLNVWTPVPVRAN